MGSRLIIQKMKLIKMMHNDQNDQNRSKVIEIDHPKNFFKKNLGGSDAYLLRFFKRAMQINSTPIFPESNANQFYSDFHEYTSI
jgi:hypothetical protein